MRLPSPERISPHISESQTSLHRESKKLLSSPRGYNARLQHESYRIMKGRKEERKKRREGGREQRSGAGGEGSRPQASAPLSQEGHFATATRGK